MSTETFGYDGACRGRDIISKELKKGGSGWELENIRDGLILGTGLGAFPNLKMNGERPHEEGGPLRIPFSRVFSELGIEGIAERQGHNRELVIGPLEGDNPNRLMLVQAGREHPYEGVDVKRSTFWIRVMQMLGVETLISSNAAGIITPNTLKENELMLVRGYIDNAISSGRDNPLEGVHDPRLGPLHPHKSDYFPEESRKLIKRIAEEMGLPLHEGVYIRRRGPDYESEEEIYKLRAELEAIHFQHIKQRGVGVHPVLVKGAVGMSSTYEVMARLHAQQSEKYPAFNLGSALISVCTNYAGSLGPEGRVEPSNDDEVVRAGNMIQAQFCDLVGGSFHEIRAAA